MQESSNFKISSQMAQRLFSASCLLRPHTRVYHLRTIDEIVPLADKLDGHYGRRWAAVVSNRRGHGDGPPVPGVP
jgi:hypothetical protein